jgi:hypothetical protein
MNLKMFCYWLQSVWFYVQQFKGLPLDWGWLRIHQVRVLHVWWGCGAYKNLSINNANFSQRDNSHCQMV